MELQPSLDIQELELEKSECYAKINRSPPWLKTDTQVEVWSEYCDGITTKPSASTDKIWEVVKQVIPQRIQVTSDAVERDDWNALGGSARKTRATARGGSRQTITNIVRQKKSHLAQGKSDKHDGNSHSKQVTLKPRSRGQADPLTQRHSQQWHQGTP